MRGTDFVVPVGADQKQVPHFRVREQMLDQVERRGVEPLQIVEEEGERMFRSREHFEEAPEHQLETALCVLWRKLRNRRLRADEELQFGDKVNHKPPIWVQSLAQRVAPAGQLGLALTQQRPDQALKGLRQCGIRDVALVLIELA